MGVCNQLLALVWMMQFLVRVKCYGGWGECSR